MSIEDKNLYTNILDALQAAYFEGSKKEHDIVCYSENEKTKKYCCLDKNSKLPAGYKKLSLNAIIDRFNEFEEKEKNNAQVAKIFSTLAKRKIDKAYSGSWKNFWQTLSRIQNWLFSFFYSNYSYATSAERAEKIAHSAAAKIAKQAPKEIAQSIAANTTESAEEIVQGVVAKIVERVAYDAAKAQMDKEIPPIQKLKLTQSELEYLFKENSEIDRKIKAILDTIRYSVSVLTGSKEKKHSSFGFAGMTSSRNEINIQVSTKSDGIYELIFQHYTDPYNEQAKKTIAEFYTLLEKIKKTD